MKGNLIISRRLGEKILIGHDIEIQVIMIDRGKVRLRLIAPKDVPIMREEVIGGRDGTDNSRG